MDIDTTTILSILIIIILSITTIFFISEQIFCKQSLSNLQVKYEQDTTPIKLQISNLKLLALKLVAHQDNHGLR